MQRGKKIGVLKVKISEFPKFQVEVVIPHQPFFLSEN